MKPLKVIGLAQVILLSFPVWADTSRPSNDIIKSKIPFDLLQLSLSLFVILAIIFLSAFIIKRFFSRNLTSQRVIKVIDQVPMGVKDKLVLLEVGGEQVLVAISSAGMQQLHVLKNPIPEPEKKEMMPFSTALKQVVQDRT